jgi:CubicO group peptidase (beta-lactamase class C family)
MNKSLLSLFVLFAVFSVAQAQDVLESIRKVENGLSSRIQIGARSPINLEERMKSLKVPGLSIAVVKDFKLQWAKGYGVRDFRTGSPVTEETLFQAASVTKSISAVVALRLVQDGILDLDKDVNGYLKRWKVPDNEFTRVEKVTLRRLLSHTAGLSVRGFRGYAEGEAVPTILQVLDGLPPANNAPARVEGLPGSGYRYSSGAYAVLQLLLEDVTGSPLSKLVAEYVFRPAGMTRSTLCPTCEDSLAGQTSMGHSVDDAGNITTFKGEAFVQNGSGCCELWTTASDLGRFVIAMQRVLRGDAGSILSRETARVMITQQKNSPYGLGFFLLRYGDAAYFNHDGGNTGFSARFIGHPEQGYGFAFMINSDNTSTMLTELTMAVGGAYGWEGIKSIYYKNEAALFEDIRRRRKESPDDPANSDKSLNQLGFELLWTEYRQAAIGVFLLNVEFNPQSAHWRDSLGEAYEYIDDQANALKSYREAIELLDRFPEKNKDYQLSRKAITEKIRKLESKKGM